MNSCALRIETFGEQACALADSDHDDPPPPSGLSSDEEVPAIPALPEAEEPTIGIGGEPCIPALFSVPLPAQFLAELSEPGSILALPLGEVTLEEYEARLIRALAFESFFDQGKLCWAHAFGRMLLDYKRQVGHGNFESRLKDKVLGPGRSRSSVGDCMRIASVPLQEILNALNSQTSGDLSISAALEYLRGRGTDRPDGRRRDHRDRRVASPRGPSTTAPRGDGAEDRPVAHEPVTSEQAGQPTVDAPDATQQTIAVPTTSPHVSTAVFGDSALRSEGDTEEESDDGSERSSDSELVSNSSPALVETLTGSQRAGTPPPVFHVVGDEPVVASLPSLEVRATTGVENLTESPASIDLESSLTDEAWLAGFAIRSELAQTEAFDREALTWRHLQPQIQELVELAALTTDERAQISPRTWVARGIRPRIAYLAAVSDPSKWKLCDRCHGQARTPLDATYCGICRGSGFEVTQSSDGLGSSAHSDGQDA
jgi:hypothetical protein